MKHLPNYHDSAEGLLLRLGASSVSVSLSPSSQSSSGSSLTLSSPGLSSSRAFFTTVRFLLLVRRGGFIQVLLLHGFVLALFLPSRRFVSVTAFTAVLLLFVPLLALLCLFPRGGQITPFRSSRQNLTPSRLLEVELICLL